MVIYRVTQPTGFHILEFFSDGRRDVAANIAQSLDLDRGYLNTQVQSLGDYGFLRRIGPSEKSGVYEITSSGIAALEKRELYDEDREAFTEAVDELAEDIEIKEPVILTPTSVD